MTKFILLEMVRLCGSILQDISVKINELQNKGKTVITAGRIKMQDLIKKVEEITAPSRWKKRLMGFLVLIERVTR